MQHKMAATQINHSLLRAQLKDISFGIEGCCLVRKAFLGWGTGLAHNPRRVIQMKVRIRCLLKKDVHHRQTLKHIFLE
jgi:hypothetical protein